MVLLLEPSIRTLFQSVSVMTSLLEQLSAGAGYSVEDSNGFVSMSIETVDAATMGVDKTSTRTTEAMLTTDFFAPPTSSTLLRADCECQAAWQAWCTKCSAASVYCVDCPRFCKANQLLQLGEFLRILVPPNYNFASYAPYWCLASSDHARIWIEPYGPLTIWNKTVVDTMGDNTGHVFAIINQVSPESNPNRSVVVSDPQVFTFAEWTEIMLAVAAPLYNSRNTFLGGAVLFVSLVEVSEFSHGTEVTPNGIMLLITNTGCIVTATNKTFPLLFNATHDLNKVYCLSDSTTEVFTPEVISSLVEGFSYEFLYLNGEQWVFTHDALSVAEFVVVLGAPSSDVFNSASLTLSTVAVVVKWKVEAKKVFNFDISNAGLIPVIVSYNTTLAHLHVEDNSGNTTHQIIPGDVLSLRFAYTGSEKDLPDSGYLNIYAHDAVSTFGFCYEQSFLVPVSLSIDSGTTVNVSGIAIGTALAASFIALIVCIVAVVIAIVAVRKAHKRPKAPYQFVMANAADDTAQEFDFSTSQEVSAEDFTLRPSVECLTFEKDSHQAEVNTHLTEEFSLSNRSHHTIYFRFVPPLSHKALIDFEPKKGVLKPKAEISIVGHCEVLCTTRLNLPVPLLASRHLQLLDDPPRPGTPADKNPDGAAPSESLNTPETGDCDSTSPPVTPSPRLQPLPEGTRHMYLPVQLESKLSTRLDPDEIELDHAIGEGGFGCVYRGHWREQEVAVKVIKSQMSVDLDHTVETFQQEVAMMERLRAPQIITFIGAVHVPSRLAVVTEFMPLGNLTAAMKHTTFPLALKVKCLLDCARGMTFLHTSGVLHRDLKGDNLLMVSLDIGAPVNSKISDFGTTRDVQSQEAEKHLTRAMGTPIFMSPEIIERGEYSASTDVYSFAMVAYQVATEKEPYATEDFSTPWSVTNFVLAKKVRRPRTLTQHATAPADS
eukprot:TRINITY_DN1437_c0_g1_i10.p1 TRINITY_DN1437_c0_g1~~TRINITY_DN1437_c0_g1_i10.p1  ORF type:complete len:986 (+),score=137.73 TRINITY_DN1437_c0_g1_i10:141-2960(+)